MDPTKPVLSFPHTIFQAMVHGHRTNRGQLISHFHVHDARRRDDTHIPIGAGEIDYTIVTTHLEECGGIVAVEEFTDDVLLLLDSARHTASHLDGSFRI